MKFVILATGTRGDVQPFVALAQGLTAAGHEAVLAAPGSFEGFVRDHGVSFFPMGSDYAALLESPEGKAALGGNPVRMLRLAEAIWKAAGDAGLRRRAAALGETIRAENGVARAVEAILRGV